MSLSIATGCLRFYLRRQFLNHVAPSLLRDRGLGLIFVSTFYESFDMCIWLIVALHGLFLRDALLERTDRVELANSVHVERIDALEGLFSDCFLMVSEEQPSEFGPLEEILSMILRFWLRQHVNPLSSIVDLGLYKGRLHGNAVLRQKLVIHFSILLRYLCVQIFGRLTSVCLDRSSSLALGYKWVLLSHETLLEHVLRKIKTRWVSGVVVALAWFVDFHPNLLCCRQPLVVLESQFVPGYLSLLLDHLLFLVFGPLLLNDCVQKTVTWGFVHLEDSLSDNTRDLVFWNMI